MWRGFPAGNQTLPHLFMHFTPVNYTDDNSFNRIPNQLSESAERIRTLLHNLKTAVMVVNVGQFACVCTNYSKRNYINFDLPYFIFHFGSLLCVGVR